MTLLDSEHRELVKRLFEAFNHRNAEGIVAICDPTMEFMAPTAEAVGRNAPYIGPEGLGEYLTDVAKSWEELLVTSGTVERRGDQLLVRGRVYARSHELGIRDIPVAWVWQVRDGRFIRGEVFPDPEEALARFVSGPDEEHKPL
ncbi:MAG: nuclear transport factor 2 family protein [Solirubrobacterales bacterium]